MRIKTFRILVLCLVYLASRATAEPAAASPAQPLIDLADAASTSRISPSSAYVTTKTVQNAIAVDVAPGKEGYPGINIAAPAEGNWDLSHFGHVAARVVNTGEKPLPLSLRVDCAGDPARDPWNAEFETVPPGESRTVVVHFGYSFGQRGYKLDTAKITRILIFTGKSANPQSFRVESIDAEGKSGERPPRPAAPAMTIPKDGAVVGQGVAIDRAKQVEARGGATADPGEALRITFPEAAKDDAALRIKPPTGRWDFRAYTRVTVRLRNAGTTPATPRARLESQPGNNDWVAAAAPLAADASTDLILPFAGQSVWDGTPKSGPQFASDAATAIAIGVAASPGARSFIIESIRADCPFAVIPEWLGKRPPVDGKWKQSLDENFDGQTIDPARWSVVGENYYDKVTHFSPANATVKDGFAHLRFERKPGTPNDDPKRTPRTRFRHRLSHEFWQMDPAVRLLRITHETAHRQRALARFLDDARSRRSKPVSRHHIQRRHGIRHHGIHDAIRPQPL